MKARKVAYHPPKEGRGSGEWWAEGYHHMKPQTMAKRQARRARRRGK